MTKGQETCVFCKIVHKEIPAHVVYEDKDHIAFLSIFPNTDGFTVVATKKHYLSYAFANNDKVLTELVMATKKVARKIDAAFRDVGRTGMFFEGFGVDHLHSKLFPMHGTGKMKEWQPMASKTRRDFYKQYPGYLSSHDSKRADDKILARIAEKIRKGGV